MTYKEVYMNCSTFEELEEVVKKDTITALLLNTDRVAVIERVMNEVCEEKGWK
jgi:hypothetical protein